MLLSGLLRKEKIFSYNDLLRYVANIPQDSPLRLINPKNANEFFEGYSPDDNLVYLENLVLENVIISMDFLKLSASRSLKMINCIVDCKLTISGHQENSIEEVEFDNCIFIKDISLSNIKSMSCGNISLYHTNAACLSIINSNCRELLIHGCRFFMLSMHDIRTDVLEADNNEIRHFEISSYEFKKVMFDYKQVQINNLLRRLKSKFSSFHLKPYNKLVFDINLFELKSYDSKEFFMEEAQFNMALSTLAFLKENTDLSKDRNAFNYLLFLESFITQKVPVRKAVIWMTGGFLRPGRFLIAGLAIFLIFSILYVTFGMSISDALYFSGVTFTTIGYGDIIPAGFERVLAVMEGILGICTTSSFLVALVKKYVD